MRHLALLCLAALAASCATDRSKFARAAYVMAELDDDFGALDALDVETAHGADVQLGFPLDINDGMYAVVGATYAAADSQVSVYDIEAERTSFYAGLEQQIDFDERFRGFVQAGLMRNEVELTISGLSADEDEAGLYVMIGVAAQLAGDLSGWVAYRPLEPAVDDGLGGDVDTSSLLVGLDFQF